MTEDQERDAREIADQLTATLVKVRAKLDKGKPVILFDDSNLDVNLQAVAWLLGLLVVSSDQEPAVLRDKLAAMADQAMAIAPRFRERFENDPQCTRRKDIARLTGN
jgi:hypothetical protein